MAVRVRLFAAVRDAAGTAETTAEAGPLPAVLDELRARFGERFATRLAVCSVLVDGRAVPADASVEVADGAEIAILPPFSGGCLHCRS
jgi:sulfur-carrier protein